MGCISKPVHAPFANGHSFDSVLGSTSNIRCQSATDSSKNLARHDRALQGAAGRVKTLKDVGKTRQYS